MRTPAILIGAAAGSAALLALAPATADALAALNAARTASVRLSEEAKRPEAVAPLVRPGLVHAVPDEAAGRAAILARVRTLSRTGGVLVETVAAVPMPQGLAAVRLRVSGAEKAVLAFADAIERQRPATRLRSWRLEPVAGGGVRLSGEVVAPWQ